MENLEPGHEELCNMQDPVLIENVGLHSLPREKILMGNSCGLLGSRTHESTPVPLYEDRQGFGALSAPHLELERCCGEKDLK